jgi:hypothetical protein
MSAELTSEQIAAWGKRSRAASGVPAKITDPAVIAKLVTLALSGTDPPDGDGRPVSLIAKPARARKKAAP